MNDIDALVLSGKTITSIAREVSDDLATNDSLLANVATTVAGILREDPRFNESVQADRQPTITLGTKVRWRKGIARDEVGTVVAIVAAGHPIGWMDGNAERVTVIDGCDCLVVQYEATASTFYGPIDQYEVVG